MKNSLQEYLHRLRMEKKQKRRLASFITAMSVFVSTGVFWQLRGIGTAMTDDVLKMNESDTASDFSESDCSLCETSEMWESTLPELTDELAENVALIATSQLGYTTNKKNYTLGDDGFTHKNYSRYGAWFGNPYGDWNTMFTCFCLYYAGVKETDFPFGSGCWAWSLKLSEKGLLTPLNKGSPKRGDVLVLDTDLDGKADRSGIISEVNSDNNEPYITVIEGQVDGAVAECRYHSDDEIIMGYVSVETSATENLSPGDSSPEKFMEESDSGIKVYASVELGVFPYGTKMHVSDVPADAAVKIASIALGADDTEDIEAVAVDISFISPDGIEVEPTDSSAVHVEVVLPEERKLGGDEFKLFHLDDSGGTEIVENAEISGNGAVFDAESFSIYVLTSNNTYLDKDQAIWVDGHPVQNTKDSPYVLYLGESIQIRTVAELWTHPSWGTQGYPYVADEFKPFISVSSTSTRSNEAGVDYITCDSTVSALSPGNAEVRLTTNQNGGSETFYIKIIETPQIYVNTALGEKHKDYLHEYLDLHRYKYLDYPQFFIIEDGNPKYIKNGDIEYNHSTHDTDRAFLSYRISEGDIFEVVSYCKPNEKDYYDFYISEVGTHTDTTAIEKIGDTVKERVTEGEHYGEYRISARFIGKSPEGNRRACITLGSEVTNPQIVDPRVFYVVVTQNEDTMSHADIEIDDGGKYTIEEYSFDSDGNLTKLITEYSAAVADINSCKIYDENGEQLSFTADAGNVTPENRHQGQPVEFVKSDYYKRGNIGESQFELTSNYMDPSKEEESNGQKFGDLWLRGNKNFLLKDSYRADFNVDLELHEVSKKLEIFDSGGNLINTQIMSVSDKSITKNGLYFSLGRQAILDAYNKCPVHTGLDFTLAANAVMIDFQMKKEFVGGDIGSKQFTFQLLDENNNVVAEKQNAPNGIISFDNIYFDRAGTYNYTIHEVGVDTDVLYEDDRNLSIVVTEQNGSLIAEISADKLTKPLVNHKIYTLPSTGGGGVVPYMITGSAIIILSFTALLLRKRKEDK